MRRKKSKVKLIAYLALLLIVFPSMLCAKETQKGVRPLPREQEAQRYFACREIKAMDLKDEKAPNFQDYHIGPEAPARHPRVDTKTTSIGRRYRTVLRNGIASGANYAGHYAVVVWGCGSSCSSFAVVNLKTGQVVVPTDIRSVSGVYLGNTVEQFLPEGQQGPWGFRYRLDSRLLVLVGTLNEDENREGAYYFVIEGNRLNQIHETRVVKDCNR